MTRSAFSLSPEEPTTKFWNVVLFANGDLGIAPDIWLKEQQNLCAYPRVNAYTLNSLAEKCAPPKKDWPEYKINKFYHRKISSFDKAKELFAEIDSEISGTEESAPPKQAPSTLTTAVSPPSTSPWVTTNSAAKPSTVQNLTIATSGSAAKPSSDRNPTVVTSVSSATLSSDGNPTVVTSVSSATTSSDGNPTVVTSMPPATPSSNRKSSQDTSGSPSTQSSTRISSQSTPGSAPAGSSSSPLNSTNNTPGISISPALVRQLIQSNISNLLANKERTETGEIVATPSRSVPDTEPPEEILENGPLMTMSDFLKLEKKLKKSKSLRNQLRSEYKLLMRSDRGASCRSLAAASLHDSLAAKFTWKGQKTNSPSQKRAFAGTQIHRLILQSVNLKFKEPYMTKAQFQDVLADWFAQAKFRLQRREKRAAARRLQMEAENEEVALPSSESESDSD